MKVKLFYGNLIAFLVFAIVALRLRTTGNIHEGSFFMILAGTCFITFTGLAMGFSFGRKPINPLIECLIYYAFSLLCFWAGGLFDL